MKVPILIASGEGVIPVICAMVIIPYVFSAISLVISIFKRSEGNSFPAVVLGSFGCAWGLWLTILFGLPKAADWMDLAFFFSLPAGIIALLVSLRRGKPEA